MNFAQYLPTSLQGLLPDGTGSDPNQLPQDDTMMQLELKRKFALADALKNQAMPQGQMVGDRYVAPSWTQYLANAVGKYKGGQAENEAMKQYGDYRTAENTRMAEALGKFGKAFEPTTTTNTTYAPGIGKELAVGDTVQTAPNYSPTSNANEMVAPTSPYGTQSMTGNATTSVPTTTTSTVQPTAGSINQAFTDYAAATRNPKLAEQLMMNRFEAYQKRNEPFKLGKDETLFGRDENGKPVVLAANSSEANQFGKINPSEYTQESLAKFVQSKNPSDLVSSKPAAIPTTRNMRQGNQDITQQWNPSTNSWQTIATGNAFKPDAAINPNALLNKDTLDIMSDQALTGDRSVFQNLGRGRQGAENLASLRNAITEKAKLRGYSGAELAAINSEFNGINAAQRTVGTKSANIEMAATEADKVLPLARSASLGVPRSGFLPFGKVQVMFDTNTNDPAINTFATANNALVNVYARAISPTGVPTDADKIHGRELLSTAKDANAYNAVLDQMQQEINAAKASPGEVRSHIRQSITGRNNAPTGQSSVRSQADAIIGK
jgi:hypothetical protein